MWTVCLGRKVLGNRKTGPRPGDWNATGAVRSSSKHRDAGDGRERTRSCRANKDFGLDFGKNGEPLQNRSPSRGLQALTYVTRIILIAMLGIFLQGDNILSDSMPKMFLQFTFYRRATRMFCTSSPIPPVRISALFNFAEGMSEKWHLTVTLIYISLTACP